MSYILDALKKSEVERHAGRIPTVAVPHGVLVESSRPSRARVLLWACVAIAVAIALGAVWLATRYQDRPVPAAAAASRPVPATPIYAPPRVAEARTPEPAAMTRTNEAIPRLKLAISLPAREQPAPSAAETAGKAVVTPAQPAMPGPAHDSPVVASNKSTVVPYADLPPAIRQALPPLLVGGFAAGDSGGAMVMVDDKLVREGDEVAPGIRVERILADSAEFSFKGYRFRR